MSYTRYHVQKTVYELHQVSRSEDRQFMSYIRYHVQKTDIL